VFLFNQSLELRLPLEIEHIFYYTEGMTWIKTFWRCINPTSPIRLVLLELDPVQAQYLSRLAENTGASRHQVAKDLLKSALVNRQVAESHLEHWRGLTPRQQQVAALTCLNFTNRQIAARLGISPQTVKSHMRNLLHRFDLHSKEELRQALADWDFSEWAEE